MKELLRKSIFLLSLSLLLTAGNFAQDKDRRNDPPKRESERIREVEKKGERDRELRDRPRDEKPRDKKEKP
jgi:hypothetical protein